MTNLANSGLFEKHKLMTFQNLYLDSKILNKIKEYIVNPNYNIMLFGSPGTGKTHLMVAMLKEIAKTKQVKYIRFIDFIKQIQLEAMGKSDMDIIGCIINSEHIVFIDDIGVEKVTETRLEKTYDLFDLIDLNVKKGIIISSNYTLKQLSDRLSDRIVSRIAGNFDIIKITGKDRRIKND